MTVIDARAFRKINKHTKVLLLNPLDIGDLSDCDRFPLYDPPKVPPIKHRGVIGTNSPLCERCILALQYLAFVLEKRFSGGEATHRAIHVRSLLKRKHPWKVEHLLDQAAHHDNLLMIFRAARSGCHLCSLVAPFPRRPADNSSTDAIEALVNKTRTELCWDAKFVSFGRVDRGRIQFAQIKGPQRISDKFGTFARLLLWPANRYIDLFADHNKPDADGRGLMRVSQLKKMPLTFQHAIQVARWY